MLKSKLKRGPKILLFISIVVIGASTALNIITYIKSKDTNVFVMPYFKIKKEEPKEYNLSMIMAGDALIHESIYLDAKTSNTYDFKKMFVNIKPIIKQYDLAFYNQETILGGAQIGLSTYPSFNSPYEVGDAFIDMGFNMVSLANNHTLDRGSKAIINSRAYWNKQDVMVNGSATSSQERDAIKVIEKNGIRYTLLAYTTLTNGIKSPNDYYVNIYSEERVKRDIELIKEKTDFIFVSMHWGIEYSPDVSLEQKKIANYLSQLGVDIVIGHHPHVIEPIEYIDNTLVIYSLGNFISSQTGVERLSGAMVSVELNLIKDQELISKTVDKVAARLIYTEYQSGTRRHSYLVHTYDKLNDNILPDYQRYFEKLKERITKLDSSILVN